MSLEIKKDKKKTREFSLAKYNMMLLCGFFTQFKFWKTY